ncbi:AAA+ ATPase domain [Syntrophomonas zehnderi OL-4]|uniref:AAA+ ATPase domain n=1 Tax=Syntrophomonas zehnderi OL-4 TaxID=690567 RepID=A0A0E4GC78_9FIRM|nr:DUF6079 family protein [Syntrophomonas zehnderi]CFX06363.1 AAA+ ATPase domain [Syntrophomonas zehnderi OL-4]CFX33378.1 AAA+ ATPase domain [Syntrophomonas zehnderi OL-4]
MIKVRELLNFEKIKEVIDIDAIDDKQAMVEKYVISKDMQEYLVHLLEDINAPQHKAAQIVGGYGSGKSHLLAFLISILTEPKLRQYIQDKELKKLAQQIKRDFVIIHWELQPNDVDLSQYFYFEVASQLAAKYAIDIEFKTEGVVDHKKNILDLLDKIKADDPSRGLIVIMDEISDFLKQKDKEKITRDMQFMRVLGQVAQSSDFTFIGAMQEHIFSNPKYVDEAESFGRVSERFQVITIKREDIKRVIARRVLNKTPEQRMELGKLFDEYKKYYPNIQANLDEYIDLFPLHPYVIQIFSELPYFEKRGVIQFTVQEVEKVLDESFPCLITYDRIFDEMNSKHTVKNLETVSPVINAVQTLDSKIDLLDTRNQSEARQIVKALAVLHLFSKTNNNGATLEELANTLLVLPGNKMMEASDEIGLVLNRLRKVTDGQFISVTKDGYYYLDLTVQIDYDQVIERRSDNLPDAIQDERIISILRDQLMLGVELPAGGYLDTCTWTTRRSFRNGLFIYETGRGEIVAENGDYQLVFVSPFCSKNRYKAAPNRIVCSGSLSEEAQALLKKLAAVYLLIAEKYQVSIMEKRLVGIRKEFIAALVSSYLESGMIEIGKEKKSIKSLISREFRNFDELFSELKPTLLQPYFEATYPKHPRFPQLISRDNIEGEFSGAIRDLINRNGVQSLFGGSKAILSALDLVDQSGQLNTAQSEIVQNILQDAREQNGKNLDVEKLISKLEQAPYGYHPLMTSFVLVVLTYNGEIALKAAGGKTISSSEVSEVFASGLDAFGNIKYLFIESEINPQPLIELFIAIGIAPDQAAKLRKTNKRGEAVQDFRTRYLEIKEQCEQVQVRLANISLQHRDVVDVNGLKARHVNLSNLPLNDFDGVKTPADLKKIVYPKEQIQTIAEAAQVLQQLVTLYEMYSNQIKTELEYGLKVKQVIRDFPGFIQVDGLEEMLTDALAILADAEKLIDPAGRQPLLGKLQQVRKKYQAAYYKEHERCVGSKVDWSRLQTITADQKYKNLLLLKNVRILDKRLFANVENGIINAGNLRCDDFKLELLENEAMCLRCHFPSSYRVDLKQRLDVIEERIEASWKDWESNILTEVNNYKDNIQYLQADEKQEISYILKNGTLPEVITTTLVKALNHLFDELEIIELNPKKLMEHLFKESQVLDYYSLERNLNEFKQMLVAGKDLEKIRIKQAEKDGE